MFSTLTFLEYGQHFFTISPHKIQDSDSRIILRYILKLVTCKHLFLQHILIWVYACQKILALIF